MDTVITYLGHSTVALDVCGVRLLTDPVLRGSVGYLRRVAEPLDGHPEGDVTGVLVSHVHHDHADGPSLRLIGAETPVVAPRGAGRLLQAKGMRAVVEVAAGERTTLGGVPVLATPAAHEATRLPGGRRVPALGYVVGEGPRIYFAGDTDLFDGMQAIGDLRIDVALVPVAGWGSRLPAGHLDPERAALALRLLRPRIAVPIHWGTLAPMWWRRQTPAARRAPAQAFARAAARTAPEVEVRIVEPGAALTLGAGVAR